MRSLDSGLYEFAYSVNAVGNRTQVVDPGGTTTYGYVALQRLASATYPGPSTDSYTYDAMSNRAAKNSTTYTYDDADQLTAVGSTSYGYDNNGNQTSRGSDTFAWDHENRMTSSDRQFHDGDLRLQRRRPAPAARLRRYDHVVCLGPRREGAGLNPGDRGGQHNHLPLRPWPHIEHGHLGQPDLLPQGRPWEYDSPLQRLGDGHGDVHRSLP